MWFTELKYRLEYNLKCLFYKDGSWEMNAHFVECTGIPLFGYWINEKGTHKTYPLIEEVINEN